MGGNWANTGAGGGLYIENGSEVMLTSGILVSNRSVAGGAAFQMGSTLNVNHGTFLDNTANSGAAIQSQAAALMVRNSIVWASSPPEDALTGVGGQATVTYSNVELGCTVAAGCTDDEQGNFSADPRIGAYHQLESDSPCIDVAGGTSPPLDAAGNSRVDVPGVGNDGASFADLGAMEFQLVGP
jgi:hypothetical protein